MQNSTGDKHCGKVEHERSLLDADLMARWAGLPMLCIATTPHDSHNGGHTLQRHVVAMIDSGQAQAEFGYRQRSVHCDLGAGSIGVFAAGTHMRLSRWRWRTSRRIMLEIDMQSLPDSGLLERLGRAPVQTEAEFHDGELAAVLRSMVREVAEGSPNGRLFAESLSLGVAARLQQRAAQRLGSSRERGRLTSEQLGRVEERIRTRLSGDLSLGELAQVAGFSQAHFVRLFKNAVGCAPYRHVLRVRLETARALVLDSALTLTAIAHDTGFASQSHMTAMFSSHFGVSPGEMRRARRARQVEE
jgi:AraC family transcriptional regulator